MESGKLSYIGLVYHMLLRTAIGVRHAVSFYMGLIL